MLELRFKVPAMNPYDDEDSTTCDTVAWFIRRVDLKEMGPRGT